MGALNDEIGTLTSSWASRSSPSEALRFDGVTATEHHAPLMRRPSPHLLPAAAAARTSRIRLGTALTVLPLRVAEENRPAIAISRTPEQIVTPCSRPS